MALHRYGDFCVEVFYFDSPCIWTSQVYSYCSECIDDAYSYTTKPVSAKWVTGARLADYNSMRPKLNSSGSAPKRPWTKFPKVSWRLQLKPPWFDQWSRYVIWAFSWTELTVKARVQGCQQLFLLTADPTSRRSGSHSHSQAGISVHSFPARLL